MPPKPKVERPKRRFLKAKLITLGLVALAGLVAVETGWAVYGWAHLVAKVFPRDESLLAWVPPDTPAVAILDPHLVDRRSVPSALASSLDRVRADVEKSIGVDLGFDLDKLVVAPQMAIARGRFNGKKLAERLKEGGYEEVDHLGVTYSVKKGEDAIAVVNDSVLLYGDEPNVVAAIDAHDAGQSLEKNEQVLDRLKQVGWDHALVFTVRIQDDKPSVRAVLSGANGPRAITGAASTKNGVDLVAMVEMPSASAAEEAKKTAEEKRGDAKAIEPIVGADTAGILADIEKRSTVSQTGNTVTALVHVEAGALDKLVEAAKKSPKIADVAGTAKMLRFLLGT